VTIRSDIIIVKIISADAELVKEVKRALELKCMAITNETTANAFAGVGKPLNEVVCESSMLNFASRSAAQTGITAGSRRINIAPDPIVSENQVPFVAREEFRSWYKIIAGATPKLTTSARESSSLPISEYAFRSLAESPSRKSKIIATSMSQEAFTISPLRVKTMDMNPAVRLSDVMKFGICLIIY